MTDWLTEFGCRCGSLLSCWPECKVGGDRTDTRECVRDALHHLMLLHHPNHLPHLSPLSASSQEERIWRKESSEWMLQILNTLNESVSDQRDSASELPQLHLSNNNTSSESRSYFLPVQNCSWKQLHFIQKSCPFLPSQNVVEQHFQPGIHFCVSCWLF